MYPISIDGEWLGRVALTIFSGELPQKVSKIMTDYLLPTTSMHTCKLSTSTLLADVQ